MLRTIFSILLCLVGGVAVIIFLIKKWLAKNDDYWPKKGVYFIGGKVRSSILFNVWKKRSLIDGEIAMYSDVKAKNKPFGGFAEFTKPLLYIRDLDLIRHICVKDFDHFVNRRSFNMKKTDPHFYKMLFNMESEEWKVLRSKMSPTFTTGKIRRMFDIFDTSGKRLVKYLGSQSQKSDELDLIDGFGKYTMDVIASAAFGVDSKCFDDEYSTFTEMGKRMSFKLSIRVLLKFIAIQMFPKLAELFGITLGDRKADKFFTDVIVGAIKHREISGEKREDFLQLMLEARDGQLKLEEAELDSFEKDAQVKVEGTKTKVNLDDDVIVAQSILFFLAGSDTTQSLLSFTAYQLALCPDIQEKLLKEIETTLTNNDGNFTYESINRMEYLDKVVNETLRMYPPAARTERSCNKEYTIPNTDITIETGTIIALPVYAIHHDENNYPEPEKFDPERFSAENKANRHPYAFMPFGHGPRNCIGMRFALTESKLSIAHLVKNFIVEPCEKTMIPMKFSNAGSTKPLNEAMWLKLKPRK